MDFLNCIDGLRHSSLNKVDFYTSHEALHLHYEQALTRKVETEWYNLSTHFPWIGMRTAHIDGAHVEYLRGIANPVGVKVGPEASSEWLEATLKTLNPNKEKGRLVLITRLGAKQIAHLLLSLSLLRVKPIFQLPGSVIRCTETQKQRKKGIKRAISIIF